MAKKTDVKICNFHGEYYADSPEAECPSCQDALDERGNPTDEHTPRYRWEHPMDWLRDSNVTKGDLLNFIAAEVDGDQIQDYFQSDMDADGYFVDLMAPTNDEEEEAE